MTRTSDDRSASELRSWLGANIDDLPSGGELPPEVRSDVLSRLPGTPQRRRWWPLRWFPFGIGTTRSADSKEPHVEGRTKSMFTATRIAAGVAALALIGSLTMVVGPANPGPSVPGVEAPAIDPADFGGFSGTMMCSQGEYGTHTTFDWGTLTEGETYADCLMETDDPRINGNNHSIHNYYKYDGQPLWGVRNATSVITNDDGAWVSDMLIGYQEPWNSDLTYTGEYRGTGAFEGLTALLFLTQDSFGLTFDVDGVIIPGTLPEAPESPIDAALVVD